MANYDLIITTRGVMAMRTGFFERKAPLSMSGHFDPDQYTTTTAINGTVYRIDKRDADSPAIKRYLQQINDKIKRNGV